MARIEDVLDLYHQEYNPERPVVCFDETPMQLTGDVRPPIKAKPSRVPASALNAASFPVPAWTDGKGDRCDETPILTGRTLATLIRTNMLL